MPSQKRIAVIQDLTGFGKCSLTVALPLLSSAGVEACPIPTAVLSTHTGGLDGFTYRDLTEDLYAFGNHWKSLGIHFDAIYTGFLASPQQISVVSSVIEMLKTEDTLVIADPCMADNGKLYRVFTPEMAHKIGTLCRKADVIVPNITEACMLLGWEYQPGPYSEKWIQELLHGLQEQESKNIVLTGVYWEEQRLGAACCDQKGKIQYVFTPKVKGHFHGTGDIFASVLSGSLLNGQSLLESARIAADFTYDAVLRTSRAGTDPRYGVQFEPGIPRLIRRLSQNL